MVETTRPTVVTVTLQADNPVDCRCATLTWNKIHKGSLDQALASLPRNQSAAILRDHPAEWWARATVLDKDAGTLEVRFGFKSPQCGPSICGRLSGVRGRRASRWRSLAGDQKGAAQYFGRPFPHFEASPTPVAPGDYPAARKN